jgi:quinoprotein glucose dehydrogenase
LDTAPAGAACVRRVPGTSGTLFWITVAVLLLFGVYLAAGGIWLLGLGGTAYYLIAGVALLATAALLF